METSAACSSKAVCSNLYSPYSDRSHLQFYAHGTRHFKSLRRPSLSLASKSVMMPLRAQALCELACKAPMDLTAEQAMKELSDLKLQMKLRKKELKAFMEKDKKRLKLQLKEEKKRKKQNDSEEGKTKMKSSQFDSSSSSSESSDGECSSVSMRILRQGQSMHEEIKSSGVGYSVLEGCVASSAAVSSVVSKNGSADEAISSLSADVGEGCTEKSFIRATPSGDGEISETCLAASSIGSSNSCTSVLKLDSKQEDVQTYWMPPPCSSRVSGRSGLRPHALPTSCTSNRIEVCAGGKCKKAGSELLLSALQGQIPASSNVEAVPCKCMGKCGMAINTRVLKEGTNPEHHSCVSVQDGALILSHHFGLGCPPVGLPPFSAKDGMRAPSSLVTA